MILKTPRITLAAAILTAALASANAAPEASAQASSLASAAITTASTADIAAYDGVVEAVRQSVIAAQVFGAVVALEVKAGDTVKAGQLLLRLDARAAEQLAAAGAAQVQAARAGQDVAAKEFARQKLLLQSNYISQAAFERAEAQFKSTQADAEAQLANAGAARTQSGFYVVRAPYAGIVADVAVVLGDMATPGRPLMTVYDPAALRVSASVPQTVAARLPKGQPLQIELPGAVVGRINPTRTQLLPTVDPASHTQQVRLDLPSGLTGVTPGMFARAWLPGGNAIGGEDSRLSVPSQAVVRRAELTAVYVIGADGKPLLRQVRLGRVSGAQVEVLSGVAAGERVALDPQAASRVR